MRTITITKRDSGDYTVAMRVDHKTKGKLISYGPYDTIGGVNALINGDLRKRFRKHKVIFRDGWTKPIDLIDDQQWIELIMSNE